MGAVLREKQINALKRMLNFNATVSKSSTAEPVWKILVYDRYGQDIISPLLSVKDLREMGVTLHLLLHSDREPIPDVPAVYFVMPTQENISRISQDFRSLLYDSYYLNFIAPISRQRLEELAGASLQCNCVSSVNKVFDQYLNFITVEDDMFILRHQDRSSVSYFAVNRGDVKDTEMETIIDSIVDSLFSVFVTLGVVPIIRSPRGNAGEMVAEKLDKKIRENLRDTRNSLFATDVVPTGPFGFQRPLLVILDRNQDMATPLHHTWTYQALAHDVLDLQLNRVTLEETVEKPGHAGARPRKRIKTFDLSSTDKFWVQYKGSPFPTVAEAVQEELDSYRTSEEEVKRLKAAMGLEGDNTDEAISMVSDNTAKLTSAVSSLPELLEKKRLVDMHMTIATAILDHIKARKLDVYFEIEEKILGKTTLEKSLMDMITDPEAGTPADKLRLFLISYICGPSMTEAEVDQYVTAMRDAGCDCEAVNYMRRWKTYSKLSLTTSQYSGGTKTVSMFSKLMSHGSQFVMEGVKNLVVKKHNLPITRIVDSLMEMKSLQETDDYRYFDPKLLRATDSSTIPRNRSPFQDAIVFVVGGGNYIEYQNLVDYTKGKSGPATKKILYGCTDLVNADQFLKQLSQLGQEIH